MGRRRQGGPYGGCGRASNGIRRGGPCASLAALWACRHLYSSQYRVAVAVASEPAPLPRPCGVASRREPAGSRGAVHGIAILLSQPQALPRTSRSCLAATPSGQNGLGPCRPESSCWEPRNHNRKQTFSSYIDLPSRGFPAGGEQASIIAQPLHWTGGLDTRAILAALSGAGVKLTACTIHRGRKLFLALDAAPSPGLCQEPYGIFCRTVRFLLMEQFPERICRPTVVEASAASRVASRV